VSDVREATTTIRRIALALLAGAALALAFDVLLQTVLGFVRVESTAPLASWIVATTLRRSVWLFSALLLWLTAPTLASALESDGGMPELRATPAQAARAVGVGIIAIPLLWVAAAAAVRCIDVTLAGTWTTEGRIFLEPQFYADIVAGYGPWVLSGLALTAVSRHLQLAGR